VVLDFFAEHLHLGVVEIVGRLAGLDLGDQLAMRKQELMQQTLSGKLPTPELTTM
jgi:hypothetical protein